MSGEARVLSHRDVPFQDMKRHANDGICEWIVRAALTGSSEVDILTGVSERLTAGGMSLVRASTASNLLDPMFDGRGIRWMRGEGGVEEAFPRTEIDAANENFAKSPFFALLESGLPTFRRRL